MPKDGTLTLSDVGSDAGDRLRAMGRRGCCAVATLIKKHTTRLTDLWQALADCPKARSASPYDRCKVIYAGRRDR
jgi:hypothetical protein